MVSSEVDSVFYNEVHIEVVESGFSEIRLYLETKSISEIRSLLFCLDKYLDPYYGYKLTYTKEIYDLLEQLLKESDCLSVKEDCLDLIQMYSDRDYEDCEILESGEIMRYKGIQ